MTDILTLGEILIDLRQTGVKEKSQTDLPFGFSSSVPGMAQF